MSDRQDTYTQWANERSAPAERIVAFRSWVYAQLGKHLRWPADKAQREREIGQAAHWVERMVADLGAHGYLFRPRELAALIEQQLKLVRNQQDKGGIQCIWSYLRTIWETYVRHKADDLRDQAMSLGCHAQQISAKLLQMAGNAPAQPPPPTMPEILLEVQRARASRRKAALAESKLRPKTVRGRQLELFS
jgi:hypothetical protein